MRYEAIEQLAIDIVDKGLPLENGLFQCNTAN